MVKAIRTFFLSFTILAFLLFSTIGTTTAYADDGTGTATSETTTAKEEAQPSEPVTDEGQPADPRTEEPTPPVDEGQPPVEPPTEATVEVILEQVPENTTVTVLNSEGEALPLALQESADAIATSAPFWCPGLPEDYPTPAPGLPGCTTSFTSFTDLLTELQNNPETYQGAGTIFVQQGAYLGGETVIDFNLYDLSNISDSDLTVQGGWNSTTNTVESNTNSNFIIPIIIGSSTNPWAGSLTINNISIDGVSSQTGLTLYTEGDINLNFVEVTNSQSGADLDAGDDADDDVKINDSKFNNNKKGGANIQAGGGVFVNFSEFNGNGSNKTDGYGVKIESGGQTSLYYMSASNNEIFGADVTAGGPVSIDNGFFNNNVSYYYGTANGGYGLKVVSQGDITLDEGAVLGEGIQANGNYFFGAYLEGVNVYVAQSQFNGNGSGSVENPVGRGLEVVSSGGATLISNEASQNQLFGVNVDANGNVVVTNGFFNSNQGYYHMDGWVYTGYGLQVTTGGNIDVTGVSANDNYLFGAYLEGKNVKVTNSFFSDNDSDWHEHSIGYGLKVVSTGFVTLTGVTANNNQRFGADIEAIGEVEVNDSFFNGNTSYTYSCKGDKLYYGYGIRIFTSDDAFLNNVEAVGNYLYGAHIEANDVAIDTANFSNNGSGNGLNLTGYGLEIISEIDVALIAVTANNNQLFGANIVAGEEVAIAQSYFNGHIAYYYDYFSGEILSRDGGYGLRVITLGDIAIEDVTADNNYLYGAYLAGDDMDVEDSYFTANGSGLITEPTGFGLQIVSTGSVDLVNINDAASIGNQLFGANIAAAEDVTIINSFFSGHQTVTFTPCLGLTFYGYGLTVVAEEDIFLNYVTANSNNLWGASLTGDDVSVYNSQFNNNVSDSNIFIDDTGLIVDASGDVDIYRTEARENRLIGATITADGDVFIAESTFSDNRGYTCLYDWCPEGSITYHGLGLQVTTPGLINVTATDASNNNLFGAELNGGLVNVENSTFNNNGMGNGLTVTASDNVTLLNITATQNGGNGVEVNGACTKTVTVTGGTFSDNILYGLRILNAILNADGTQVFVNNGSGNIFTDTSICVVVNP